MGRDVDLSHLYSTFSGTSKCFTYGKGESPQPTNVQHPPGWSNGSHIAPERPPHTSLLVERSYVSYVCQVTFFDWFSSSFDSVPVL